MSTHIYSTFLSRKGDSVFKDIIKQSEESKERNKNSYIEMVSKEIADSILFESGLVMFKTYPDIIKILNIHYNSSNKEFSRLFENEKVSIVLYDTKDTKIAGKGLCQAFMPNNFWLKKELEDKFEDFDYTNATDMPEISRGKRLLRRNVWDTIFKDSSVPSEAGTSVDIYNFLDELQQNFTSVLDEIVSKVIEKVQQYDFKNIEKKIYIQIKISNHDKELKELDFNKVMRVFLKYEYQYRSEFENSISLNEVENKKMEVAKSNFEKMKNEMKNLKEPLTNELKNLLKESIEVTNEHNKKMDEVFNKIRKLK